MKNVFLRNNDSVLTLLMVCDIMQWYDLSKYYIHQNNKYNMITNRYVTTIQTIC